MIHHYGYRLQWLSVIRWMAVAECLIRMRQISSPENSGAAIPRNSISYRHKCEGDDVNAAIKFEATQPRRPSGRSRSLAGFSQ